MKTLIAAAALLAASLASTSTQAATVVTFSELAHTSSTKLHRVNPLVSGGLSFSTSDRAQGLASWGTHSGNADPTGATLMNWSGLATVTISKVGGGLFNLGSIDFADYHNAGSLSSLEFTYFDGVRTVSEMVELDRVKGLQTIAFNRNVEWFSFRHAGNSGAQIDNVTWGDAIQSAVPEPATWAMMIVGFAGVGGMVRRSRRQVQAAFA